LQRDATHATFGWTFSHYFQFVRDKDKNIIVKCNLCATPRELSTSRNSTSNLKKQLDRCHANTKLTERAARVEKRKNAEDESAGKIKQQKLSSFRTATLLEPREVKRLVPLSTVESPAFRKLVSKIPVNTSNVKVSKPCRLFNAYDLMEKELKKVIEAQQYVSTTADMWSANNKSFMGVTVHWIDADTLKRKKAAIACRRFREEIFSQYGLTYDKVTACVTDNRSNFVKAFKEHQHVETEEEDEVESDGEVDITDLHSVFTTDDDDPERGLCVLPPHHRCASHTLNLMANNEVDKWLASNPESRAVYRSATAKCSALWTKASHSTVAAKCLEEVSDRKLIVPTVTRWNSFYDAYARITEMPLSDINKLYTQLQIKCMNDREYQFLKEYCSIMKPFTVALDILQGEDTCFYGTLQPTLEVLMAKTLAAKNGVTQMTTGLPEIIVGAIKTRFAATIDSKDALLAAVSLPKFKLRWIKEEARRDHIKFLLTTECRSLTTEELAALMPDVLQPAAVASSEEDFFSFDALPSATADALILHQFPRIKKIALRYNAPTPSSAPVERLFSLGSLVLTPKRNRRLGDGRFQRLLLMCFNRYFGQLASQIG
uniref:HAT C-terminal dimerisation domain-containing protein n=1 Tax=Sander lucioperca TaxID=283035 RepID=A0A8C9Y7A9_SANLU